MQKEQSNMREEIRRLNVSQTTTLNIIQNMREGKPCTTFLTKITPQNGWMGTHPPCYSMKVNNLGILSYLQT